MTLLLLVVVVDVVVVADPIAVVVFVFEDNGVVMITCRGCCWSWWCYHCAAFLQLASAICVDVAVDHHVRQKTAADKTPSLAVATAITTSNCRRVGTAATTTTATIDMLLSRCSQSP